MTTIETLTDEQLVALRGEAAAAGDSAQVELCRRALRGDERAMAACVRVISEAESQERS